MNPEWLEADGEGGFASGPVTGCRTRRYHALLLTGGARRFVLVNGFDALVETAGGRFPLTTQRWASGVVAPDGARSLEHFDGEPWPRWRYAAADGTRLELELFVRQGGGTFLRWHLLGTERAVLRVRLYFSGRDYHALHHENPAFRFTPGQSAFGARFTMYDGVPGVVMASNGQYRHEPSWYRGFHYPEEEARGLDCVEDLASPGEIVFALNHADGYLVLAAEGREGCEGRAAPGWFEEAEGAERKRRGQFRDARERAADSYIVNAAGGGKTIIAGYPWFTDWGRDTFIAVRGLALATKRYSEARAILLRWSDAVSQGMLPNRFPDDGGPPEYNAVDAALWFVVAASELPGGEISERQRLDAAIEAILDGHVAGTRHGIRVTDDGLLAAGEPGVQLTWMDAKVGDRVITPRVGKPVEVQALWLNALAIGARLSDRWQALFERGRRSFAEKFWNDGALHDVVDVDHRAGVVDATFRPNQIFAVGGLPLVLLDAARARAVVDAVEARLLTPMGLRSLAPGEPGYSVRYCGGPAERDAVYHQGTVWPWLLGPFVEAWLRVHGNTPEHRHEARRRFVEPLGQSAHVPEVADAEPPHNPGGCPFQAWSVGELLRLERDVLVAS